MIEQAAITFGISVLTLFVLTMIIGKERRHGRRFFAAGLRGWLDKVAEKIGGFMGRHCRHFIKYVVQLSWYYSLHSFLKTCLRVIVSVYNYFESRFESNRQKAKQLRAERKQLRADNHLQQMAAHKEDTSLTPAQKARLKKKKLESE